MTFRANHGGILQSYALQHLLEGWGHQVVKAEQRFWPRFHFSWYLVLVFFKRCVLRYILCQPIELLPEWNLPRRGNYHRKHILRFINKYIHTIEVESFSQLDGSEYDAVIVGSDQVWRREYTWGYLTDQSKADNVFLAFTRHWRCLRIAYAASFGVDYWEYSDPETTVLQQLIRQFDAISVREDSAIDLIHRYLDASFPVEHVLDPTMLIPREDYIRLIRKAKTHKSQGNLLLYILDPSDSKSQFIQDFSYQKGLTPFYVNNPKCEDDSYTPEERIQVPIEQWLRGFMEADFVLADSFHACVFSIIFEKPFLVFINPERGNTRLESLMNMFGISNRIVDSSHPINDIAYLPEINWQDVNNRKVCLREQSLLFLKNALTLNPNRK
mgnify:CR=1 FL=1